MRLKTAALCLFVFTFPACNRTDKETANLAPAEVVKNENPPATATEARVEGVLPNDRTPISEPKGPIDPNSIEGAGQVVQHYGALIEQRQWLKAERLWGDVEAARAFASALGGAYREVHLEIGPLGEAEGAAGSIFLTEPVIFYGKTTAGAAFRRPADIILRRVNDVPGSTDAQRRWHIDRIEWKGAR